MKIHPDLYDITYDTEKQVILRVNIKNP